MKKSLGMLLVASLITITAVEAQNEEQRMDSVSYSVGVLMAQSLKQQGLTDVSPEAIARAIGHVLNNQMLEIEVEQCNQLVQDHMNAAKEKQFEMNIKEGKEFLEANSKREGVVTLPSGLQYEILTEGSGPMPKSTDKVTVHYTGMLLNGQVFDSSVKRGQPATFGVTQVIQGWVEGLQLMPEGSKWKLYIPYDMAYGERGAGKDIPPYAALIFEVELLKIN